MAGVVPFSSKNTTRKLWNIKDKRSVRRLRSRLAEDGCPESQLVLAKQLLEEKSDDSENAENARLGVFWLMQASEQGSQEATEMLQACLDSGEGVTEHNYLDIKACLNTSLNEKLARRAAREIFLSLSAGQDFITTEQLRRQMKDVAKENTITAEIKSLDEHWGEKLTEDHLEEAAANYSRGELPLVQQILALADPQRRELARLSYLHRSLRHPLLSIQYAYASLLDLAFQFVLPRGYIFLLIIIFTPLDSFLLMLPMVAFYSSFFFMVISTLQMLHSRREYRDFRNWSRLFLRYDRDGNLNTEDPEFVYIKKNLQPYGIFFLNLLIHLACYPLVSSQWMPHSEFALLSFLLTFITLSNFSIGFDFLQFLSFGLHVLAKYPYENDGVVKRNWRFLDFGIPCFASRVVGNSIEFCLNFRGIFYLMIPGIFVKVAARQGWRGTYKFLIPHCVTLAWWQIAVLNCQGATLYGLIRSTLAMVGLILLVPLLSIASFVIPVLAVIARITEPALTPMAMTTSILAVVVLILGIYLTRYQCHYQIFMAVIAAAFLLHPYLDDKSHKELKIESALSWEEFSKHCRKSPFPSDVTTAAIQEKCLNLQGVFVHWEAVVHDVRIVNVYHPLKKYFDHLPEDIKSPLICLFGEKNPTNCELCKFSKEKCSFKSQLEFEISLRVESTVWFAAEPIVTLKADDSFKNFTMSLVPKDTIWFKGHLYEPVFLSGQTIKVSADEIGCVTCRNKELNQIQKSTPELVNFKMLQAGVLRILNFVFNPVILFH